MATSRVQQLITNVQATDEFLIEAVELNQAMALRSVKKLQDRIIDLMKELDTKGGSLEGIKINLKQSQKIHKDMLALLEKEYGPEVLSMISNFDDINKFIVRSWKDLGETAKYTGIDRTMMEVLRTTSYDQFLVFGEDAVNRIAQGMYDSVIAGEKFSELVKTVRGVMVGHVDRAGRPMAQYARQAAFDTTMNYHNEVNLQKANDLGFNHYLYVGDIIKTTRPFCETRAGGVYTRGQITSWNRFNWQGKSGPAMTNRGGYNCRHHWRPVKPEWIPEGRIEVQSFNLENQQGT
jgi:hypothetical protein